MRILIVGSKQEWAFENHYLKHLEPLCDCINIFAAHDMFYDYYYTSIRNKLLFRLGLSNIYSSINNKLVKYLQDKPYDIVWVFKGMELYPKTITLIKEMGIKLVNLNPDHPFIHTYRGSGNKNVLESIPYFHLHLCYNLNVKKRIENNYNIWCEWLPFGFEQRPDQSFPSAQEEVLRCCFIGNPDNYRSEVLLKIAESGIPLDLYGNQWEKWLKPTMALDIRYHDPVYKNDFDKTAIKYRLHINIFRPHNDNSHNMRSLEMPGLGCIMLAPESKEHHLLFKENKEVFFYNNIQDLLTKALFILNMPYEEALHIRMHCRTMSAEKGYDYASRAKQVSTYFKKLIGR